MALCWEQTHELLRTLLWQTRTVPKSTTLPQTSSEYGGGGGGWVGVEVDSFTC